MRALPLLAFAGLAGCASHYTPARTGDIRTALPAGFAPRDKFALRNGLPREAEERIGKTGDLEPVYANLHDWTDVVIAYQRAVLGERALAVADGSPRWLDVRVAHVAMSSGQYVSLIPVVRPSCQVELWVATGSGYSARYLGQGKQFYSWDSACEDATREVAAQMLHDAQILRYLTQ
jgi:hypothetical protein